MSGVFDTDYAMDELLEQADTAREDDERALHAPSDDDRGRGRRCIVCGGSGVRCCEHGADHTDEDRARADLYSRRIDSQVTPLGGVSGRPERPCTSPPQDGASAQALEPDHEDAPAPLQTAGG
jgi:hypothetical protein